MVGWGVFGLGLANMAPAVVGAAVAASDRPPAAAIAAVTTVGYLGSFIGPPVVGVVASVTSLSTALSVLVVVALISAGLARPALRNDNAVNVRR